MQALFLTGDSPPYTGSMQTGRPSNRLRPFFGQRLHALRERAGLSQRELAARVGLSQRSLSYWERSPVALRPDQLFKLAEALQVSVEELLGNGQSPGRRGAGPTGRLQKVFEAASRLPRRQQQKIAEFVEAFVSRHTADSR